MLESLGYHVTPIQAGCCGMAGAFGYEKEHYALSMQIGEVSLFPAIRKEIAEHNYKVIVAASGASCRPHIEDGTGLNVVHPIELI